MAFLGSSGVGKSTLTNALLGVDKLATQAIREDDAKGRHTTTHRQLHAVPGGCLVLDTPGMRELQMAEAADGIADLFDDITALAAACRFSDCAHETEPGCAVRAAIAAGTLEADAWRAGPSCRPRMPSTPPASPNAATATAPSARWCARRRNRPRTSGASSAAPGSGRAGTGGARTGRDDRARGRGRRDRALGATSITACITGASPKPAGAAGWLTAQARNRAPCGISISAASGWPGRPSAR